MSSGLRFLLGFAFSVILLLLVLSWPAKEKQSTYPFKQPTFRGNRYGGIGGVETIQASLPRDSQQPGVPQLP